MPCHDIDMTSHGIHDMSPAQLHTIAMTRDADVFPTLMLLVAYDGTTAPHMCMSHVLASVCMLCTCVYVFVCV